MKFKERIGSSAMLLLLSACGAGSGESPPKCIDNKPAPTEFSNSINVINHEIPLEQALTMTQHLSDMRDSLLTAYLRNKNIIPVSETFNLGSVDKILCQPNTVAFRAYLGLDPQTHQMRLIFVGVNTKGQDIINTKGAVRDNPSVMETGQRFP